jgi:hypothetical protein
MIIVFEDKTSLGLPTWDQLSKGFGPYLGTLIFFISIVLFLQWYWYRENVKSKKEEIERCNKRNEELSKQNMELIDKLLGKG